MKNKKMKKTILLVSLVLALLVTAAGCQSSGDKPAESSEGDASPSAIEPNDVPTEGDPPVSASEPSEEPAAELILNQYDGLEFTAAVLERKAILPGSVVPVTVVVENTGDKAVLYTKGSGSFETPQALRLEVEGLQPLLPKDHLGIATMDFVTERLEPGDSIRFVLNLLVVEPNAQVDTYAYERFMESEEYLGEMEWAALQEAYPDLVAAKSGSYPGKAIFQYAVEDEEGGMIALGGPTGYAEAAFTIGVSE